MGEKDIPAGRSAESFGKLICGVRAGLAMESEVEGRKEHALNYVPDWDRLVRMKTC